MEHEERCPCCGYHVHQWRRRYIPSGESWTPLYWVFDREEYERMCEAERRKAEEMGYSFSSLEVGEAELYCGPDDARAPEVMEDE